ncbi:hypothetical protein N8I77_002804 [Diaporthe amygdali]|uniref:Uncharacterized protein n=1 Tax=Phomopsis amygdali TaxID=1214568 RepID=A0AAD9W9S7_PHOAM|nr:hypothetical protein N8I77_002804 [Diaporthe amygdali]
MASLPSQHPSLALHMTDRATTPLISSSSSSSSSSSQSQAQQQQQHQPPHQKHTKRPTTFSTSPPSTPSSPTSTTSSSPSTIDEPPSPASQQASALTSLSATALLSYDAAKRLDRGAPLRTMVEYADGGPVVLHSYMCPMGLALGVPGRNLSSASLHTAGGAAGGSPAGSVNGGDDDDDGGGGRGSEAAAAASSRAGSGGAARESSGEQQHRSRSTGRGTGTAATPTRPLSFALDPAAAGGGDDEGIDPSDPPMLTSTVVAPRAEDLREARRATARLERVARVFQSEWIATGRGGGGGNLR